MIIGNLGNDPEMRYTANGNPVTSFNIATNRNYTGSDGEKHTETEWFRVTAWRQLAELCNQDPSQGRLAYVEGRLKSNTWESPDGKTRFNNEINADKVLFLDRSPSGESNNNISSPEEGAENLPW
jgi:single-strand DNA-binding protein